MNLFKLKPKKIFQYQLISINITLISTVFLPYFNLFQSISLQTNIPISYNIYKYPSSTYFNNHTKNKKS